MKKVIWVVGVLSVLLVGCSSSDKESASSSTSTTKSSSAQQIEISASSEAENQVADMSFKNKTLEFPFFSLKIDKTQIGHDYANDETGLIIWYTVKNNSEENIVPQDLLSYLSFTQQDETSEYDLVDGFGSFDSGEALYPMYNEDGTDIEDTDKYNQALDDQIKFEDDFESKATNGLLPGKEVQSVTGITLENTEHPVTIKLSDDFLAKENEELIINLK